jgi:hypothetical protein
VDQHCFVNADPNKTFRFIADPDPTPSLTYVGKSEKNSLTSIHSSVSVDSFY